MGIAHHYNYSISTILDKLPVTASPLEIQYSNNVIIQPMGQDKTVLKINNEKVFNHLTLRLAKDCGFERFMHSMQTLTPSGIQYVIEIFPVSNVDFVRHLGMISPDSLNYIANN